MVPIAQAVVNEGTVMVEEFDAPVADGAVEGSLALDDLAVAAEIVQVEAYVESNVN